MCQVGTDIELFFKRKKKEVYPCSVCNACLNFVGHAFETRANREEIKPQYMFAGRWMSRNAMADLKQYTQPTRNYIEFVTFY